jgi:quercetin dioxygenase-like cupin family protein
MDDERIDAALDAALLQALAPVAPPAGLRARVLGRVRADAWRPAPDMAGIEVRTLHHDAVAGMVSFLLRAHPGANLPAHVHHADEECIVLEGEFTLGEHTLRAGDFELGRKGERHPVAMTATGVTVYLRGAVEDYPFAVAA